MFLENKYTRWYNLIINNAISKNRKKIKRGGEGYVYYESHHIIPRCLGGSKEVLLTAKEHFICHLLLPKMLEGSNKMKMINALIKMAYAKSHKQERYTSKSYTVIRTFIAEKNSFNFKGKKKTEIVKANMKGHSGVYERTTECKKNLSLAQKKRFENNPGVTAGMCWFTNGSFNYLRESNTGLIGFYSGQTKRKNNGLAKKK